MTDIRWIALLPDPMTGFDAPIVGHDGKPREWIAPDKATAYALAKDTLTPNQHRLASIVSVVDWESRQREPKRKADWSSFQRHARGRSYGT